MPTFHERRQPIRKVLSLRLAVIDTQAKRPIGEMLNVSADGALLRTDTELSCFRPYYLQSLLLCSDGCMSKLNFEIEPKWEKYEGASNFFYYGIQFNHPENELIHPSTLIMNELSLEHINHYH